MNPTVISSSVMDEVLTGFTIRRPIEADWPQMLSILASANFQNIGGEEMPAFPLTDCFVGVLDQGVIAVCGYKILGPTTAKNTLTVVTPEHRGCGVATRLKSACIDYLRQRGITTLFTNCDDPAVIAWNARHFGFSPTGEVVGKVEPYGRLDVDQWVTLVADL